jgi:CheY-like chemotaxis protein
VTARRVLLVDDEDDIREVAQVSLEMTAGWEVLTAGSGNEGLATAAAEQPDAILLDMMMPDMDGPTTFQSLRANQSTQHIPVVLLTAKASIKLDDLDVLCGVLGCGVEELLIPEPGKVARPAPAGDQQDRQAAASSPSTPSSPAGRPVTPKRRDGRSLPPL